MPWQFVKYVRRPFQQLFFGMKHLLEESKLLYDKIQGQDPKRPDKFDNNLWVREKIYSKSCFLTGIAAIEGFANFILSDFAVRGKDSLVSLLDKSQKSQKIERWPLVEKIYFLPSLCNKRLTPPAFYFKRNSKAFMIFMELAEIRNNILHASPEPRLALIKLQKSGFHEEYDDFEENFWPYSRIFKDYSAFNHTAAKVAYDNIIWIRDSLIKFIDRLDKKYLLDENYTPISKRYSEEEFSKEELIDDFKKYITQS